jgi:Reverse transcriptase (RNA-dependent DNA polymerase)
MAECVIIEPAKSSKYQSTICTVRKSNNTKRCVMDMKQSKENVIEPFLLQLPYMNQLLHSMADQQGQYHSCLNLASGFFQIGLKEGVSRDICSFSDPLTGLRYSYRSCPFGLQASPAALISTVMNVMSSLISQSILCCYMDDLCSAGETWPENLFKLLEKILQALDENNLSCLPAKCTFAYPSIRFLEHKASKHGLRITDDKIKILKELKVPHNQKPLQKIISLFQFFRHHVLLFSKSTYHMRNLLKKAIAWSWSIECQIEFDYMISK